MFGDTLLLANGAGVNQCNNVKKTPLGHGEVRTVGTSLLYFCNIKPPAFHSTTTDKNIIGLLKGYGGKGIPNLIAVLYNQVREEQKTKSSEKTQRMNNITTASYDATSAVNNLQQMLGFYLWIWHRECLF